MKNGNWLLSVTFAAGLGLSLGAFAGPVDVHPSARTTFRAPHPENYRVDGFANLREQVRRDAHLDIMVNLFRNGGHGLDPAKPTDLTRPTLSKTAEAKLTEFQKAHEALMKAFSEVKGEPAKDSDQFKKLEELYKTREAAYKSFFENAKEQVGQFGDKSNDWGLKQYADVMAKKAAEVRVSTGTSGTATVGPHGLPGEAAGSRSAPMEGTFHTRVDITKLFGDTIGKARDNFASIKKTQTSEDGMRATTDASKVGEAISFMYGGATDQKDVSDAILIAGKAREILEKFQKAGSKIPFGKVAELVEDLVRAKASPLEFDAMSSMLDSFATEPDAVAGFTRMVGLDIILKREFPKDAAFRGRRMAEWLSGGESLRKVLSPDLVSMKDPKERALARTVQKAFREEWLASKEEPLTKEKQDKMIKDVIEKAGLNRKNKEHEQSIKDIEEGVRKLAEARDKKGEDEALREAICKNPKCKGPLDCG